MNYFDKNSLNDIITYIQKVYLRDNRPWIIGYSGGKDSSTVTQLTFEALRKLKESRQDLHKPVYIIFADTLVENPLVINFISDMLSTINKKAKELELPIKAQKVYPKYNETFWSLLIGRGYPSPRQKFRWCTDRLKINPTTFFIQDKLSEYEEVIVLLGVRKGESASRDQVLHNSKIEGKLLRQHQTLNNAYIFSPIEYFTERDVWKYLLNSNEELNDNESISPWDTDNRELYEIYRESDAECPMVIDKNTTACGNSRFGCWTCTVVTKDKSLTGFIQSGEKWLKPLLKFRNYICEIREMRELREKKRRNGVVYEIEKDGETLRGLGPFTLKARKIILKKLLQTQKEIKSHLKQPLILDEELKTIRKEWIASGDWSDSLPKIYEKIYGEKISWEYDDKYLFDDDEIETMNLLCQENDLNPELVKKLFSVEANNIGYNHRFNIYKKINQLLHQDWLHYDELKKVKTDVK